MIEIIREYVVKEKARGHFELAYGPGGAWSQMFARAPGFRGITLLRDTANRRRYLMVEVWDTEARRAQALAEREAAYAALAAALADRCEAMTELGVFTMPVEAAVRPARGGR